MIRQVCGEKQSLKKVYFTGLGAECRKEVRDLNMKRGEIQELKVSDLVTFWSLADYSLELHIAINTDKAITLVRYTQELKHFCFVIQTFFYLYYSIDFLFLIE